MITRLHLDNFKAWKRVDVEFGQITGIFGTNSSGKSSLLQFLLMLKQTRDTTDMEIALNLGDPHQLTDLGSYRDLVFGHDESKSVSWELRWRGGAFQGDETPLRLRSSVALDGVNLRTRSLWYRTPSYSIGIERAEGGDGYVLCDANGPIEESAGQGAGSEMRPSKSYVLPLSISMMVRRVRRPSGGRHPPTTAMHLPHAYERLMDQIHYLGPLREPPRRSYRFGGVRPSNVGVRGERTMDALLAATLADQTISEGNGDKRSFQETIAFWLREMNLVSAFRLAEIGEYTNRWEARITSGAAGTETALTDVGFGISQVMPVLVLLYYVPKGSILLLEQPELHLHPSAQSVLADVFLHAARTRGVQIVAESHSEHFLRRIQRRRAEGAQGSDNVRLHFASGGANGSELADLELDRYGQIRNWPKDFFGDELGEVFAIQEAGLRRRREESE